MSPAPTTGATSARFQSGECQFEKPANMEVDCGTLIVPENRSRPNGATIRLPVATFHTRNPNARADPVVYLQGGPGGSALSVARQILDRTPFLAERDVIMFDQRGAGKAVPSLDCPESETFFLRTLNEVHSREALAKLDNDATAACRKRIGASANTDDYDSVANAADLADLRAALGYREWNLFGSSYGTRLALETMRDHPQGIRSVVLDAVFPPQIDSEAGLARNADRSFGLVFQQCAADAECSRWYPNLDRVFSEVVARLEAQPAQLQMSDWTKKRNLPARLDGDTFVSILFDMLYDTDSIPSIPRVIYEARDGRYDAFSQGLSYSLETMRLISEGMYASVECAEEVPFTTPDTVRQAGAGSRPEIGGYFTSEVLAFLDACKTAWKVEPQDQIENQAVVSEIPTLLLTGEFDPITPPAYAEDTARTLKRSYVHQFPAVGHGVIGSRYCATTVVQAFLTNPTTAPGSECITALPRIRFTPPEPPPSGAARTFTDASNGFSIDLAEQWLALSSADAGDRARLDAILAEFPEYGQFIRDSTDQLSQGMLLAGHDQRSGSDILATTTPTVLVYRVQGAMLGRTLAQIARDQITFLKRQPDLVGEPVTRTMRLGGRDMQEIEARYRAFHLGREIQVTLLNELASLGNDLYFVQFARPLDADPNPVPYFRQLASTIKFGR